MNACPNTKSSYAVPPISPARSIEGWQLVPIFECGELLEDVTRFDADRIIAKPKYYERQIPGSLPICYVRESVGQRLAQAARLLPEGWKLVIFDASRNSNSTIDGYFIIC